MPIQLDMFAVELGAAILLQFKGQDGVVRVLADAGRKRHDVHARLPDAISDFGSDELKIDLLIGTHYDADHLDGLIAIINDQRISIGEAWMPPVADDTDVNPFRAAPADEDLLALKFAQENGDEVLATYLQRMAAICDDLAAEEHALDEPTGMSREPSVIMEMRQRGERTAPRGSQQQRDALFRAHLADAAMTLRIRLPGHGEEEIEDPRLPGSVAGTRMLYSGQWNDGVLFGGDGASFLARSRATTLALIRKSTAEKAINASSLAAVVSALKARNIPIRCSIIPDGKPRRFNWSTGSSRFSPMGRSSTGPSLMLLGPSRGLVAKHWDKLPIGTFAAFALAARIKPLPITESNQLSYVMVFEYEEQRILISGDAGFVDFTPADETSFHPQLIEQLAPLHVVQVAHHAGHNKFFYHGLLASAFPTQRPMAHLLLSHATHDKTRPSEPFRQFVEQSGRIPDKLLKMVFTSEPSEPKVRDYKSAIAPVVGMPAKAGDVRLTFKRKWVVGKHSVKVP